MEPKTKTLVIGVDAAEPTMLENMMAAGDLPNLSSLQSRGMSGGVQNPVGFEAGAVWPTFHTGKLPGQQQQYDGLRRFNPNTYRFDWYSGDQIQNDYIWQYLSKQGKRCAVIDAPYCQIDPNINGMMILDWASHVPAKGMGMEFVTHPPEVAQEVLDLVGPDPTGGIACDDRLLESVADFVAFRDDYMDRLEKKGRLAAHFLSKGGWDYFETVFTDCHCIGHRLWHVNKPDHPAYSKRLEAAMGDPVSDAYRALDKSIGKLLEHVDDRTLTLLFVSHGMGHHYTATEILDSALSNIENNVQTDGKKTLKESVRSIWRLVPPETRAKLRPVKKYFNGALSPKVGEFSGGRDNRRFFEVFVNNRTGGVRVNLKGREANGIVDPSEYDQLLDDLSKDLMEIKNLETGEPLVQEIIKTKNEYKGNFVDSLPDLLVTWNRDKPINAIYSEKIGTVRRAFLDERTGDHTPYGLFMAAGGGIEHVKLNARADAIDFFPTLAASVGVQTDGFDGRPLADISGQHAGASKS